MLRPEKFQAVARKLLGKTFSAFRVPVTLTQRTGFNYRTQKANEKQQTVAMVRQSFEERQIDGERIQVGDYRLLGLKEDFDWMPSPGNTDAEHESIVCQVVNVTVDPANATCELHMRRK